MSDWINIPEDISKYQGFIYRITNLKTGKYYIGKKFYWRRIRRKPLKGYKRVRIDRVESDFGKQVNFTIGVSDSSVMSAFGYPVTDLCMVFGLSSLITITIFIGMMLVMKKERKKTLD